MKKPEFNRLYSIKYFLVGLSNFNVEILKGFFRDGGRGIVHKRNSACCFGERDNFAD
jgi:hypothetical protein